MNPERLRIRSTEDVRAAVARLRRPPPAPDLRSEVEALIAQVRERGDAALVDQARRFDCPAFEASSLATPHSHLTEAAESLEPELREAILIAAEQVRTVARALVPEEADVELPAGQRVVVRVVPVAAAGCYVPGGRAAYPSSLIMSVVPAQVAAVGRVAVASPAGPDGRVHAVVRAAAALLGVTEVYACGGATAIAALAHGTETVPAVDVVVGPGNAWVAEAKRQVSGTVGIDSVAGPSEVVILADDTAEPDIVALDLAAQAEHGPDSPAVLASDDPEVLDAVERALERLPGLTGSLSLVHCASRDLAVMFAEAFAPEHLQLNLRDARDIARGIHRAGAIFVGRNGGTAFGDYVAGSNHVLPTGGSARFASALGPAAFLRRMAVVEMPQGAVDRLTPHLARLADAEGFPLHRRSAEARTTSSTGP